MYYYYYCYIIIIIINRLVSVISNQESDSIPSTFCSQYPPILLGNT